MPTFEVTSPEGKRYRVNAPEGASQDDAIKYVQEKFAAAPAEPSTIGDVATSFGRGVAKGAIGLAGLPGDVGRLVGRGVEAAGTAIGLPKPPPEAHELGGLPSSEQITGAVEKVTGKFGEPQTTAGRYAQSVGEFVPSAFIGPGGPIAKVATTVAGGLGAQAGADIGEQFDYPEAGRFIGGLAGGAISGGVAAETQARRLAGQLPDSAKHEKAAKAGYDAISNARLQVSLPSVNALTTGIKANLENALIDESEAPAVFRSVDNLLKGDGHITSIMALYEQLGKVLPSAGEKYTAATIARGDIQEWMGKLTRADAVKGDPQFDAAMWNQARGNWLAHKKLEMMEQLESKAERQAGKSGTGTNTENVLRQRMDEILNSESKSRGLSPEVKNKIKQIVVGNFTRNTARFFGKFSGGPLSSAWPVLTGLEAGVPAGAAVAVGSTLLRELGTYLTRRQIREVENMIKSASPIGHAVAAGQAAQQPNFQAIIPAASGRAALATQADSPLAPPED